MHIKEVLDDEDPKNFVSNEFEQFLHSRGYSVVGRGSKIFYKSPKSNRVLVVVHPIADKEFLDWVNFCNQNASDPHLPKYTKLKVLNFQNPKTGQQEQYTTVFTEELYENRRGLIIEAIESWGFYVLSNPNVKFSKCLEAFLRVKEEDTEVPMENILEELYKQSGSGYNGLADLFHSVKKTVLAGKQLGYDNDLMDSNIMFNSKGQLVLNDPWARL